MKRSLPYRPSQGGEVPESVENCEDFETTERVESEYERAEDRAEDAETKTQAEAFYPRTPRETRGVKGLEKRKILDFVIPLILTDLSHEPLLLVVLLLSRESSPEFVHPVVVSQSTVSSSRAPSWINTSNCSQLSVKYLYRCSTLRSSLPDQSVKTNNTVEWKDNYYCFINSLLINIINIVSLLLN